jgi:hypothetical protein
MIRRMDQPRDSSVRGWALVVALGVLVSGAAVALAGDETAKPTPDGNRPGMMIYRDPATGRIIPPPAGAAPAPPALTAPSAPVVERPGTTPGGGYLAEPGGRAIKSMEATKDAAGNVHVDCVHGEVK